MTQYLNQQNNPMTHGGSIPGHIVINRDRKSVDRHLFYDYFVKNPRYNDQMFRRHFRMCRNLFRHIIERVKARDNYFVQRRYIMGRLDLYALQKITAVFQMLAYGCPTDATDEYIKIEKSTTIESLKIFCHAVVEEFVDEYLRSPNATDVARLLRIGKEPTRFWHKHILHDIMTTCIIMQNMIIVDERDVHASIEDHMEAPTLEVEKVLDENTRFQQFLARHR
ncbi:hypothetical protein Ddye_005673 [Dipteronia dyeriana]|uniref:Uncharacterized protein n=1 Tax=Dipteronia dyeriana TaxID=168575 RepID=A0AAE0CPV3_9ROSI|nr:hypothetical protein Ddye_005673 [Dipteronia dyeriana]